MEAKKMGTNFGGRSEEHAWDAKKYGFGKGGVPTQTAKGSFSPPQSSGSGVSSRKEEGTFSKQSGGKTGKSVIK